MEHHTLADLVNSYIGKTGHHTLNDWESYITRLSSHHTNRNKLVLKHEPCC